MHSRFQTAAMRHACTYCSTRAHGLTLHNARPISLWWRIHQAQSPQCISPLFSLCKYLQFHAILRVLFPRIDRRFCTVIRPSRRASLAESVLPHMKHFRRLRLNDSQPKNLRRTYIGHRTNMTVHFLRQDPPQPWQCIVQHHPRPVRRGRWCETPA